MMPDPVLDHRTPGLHIWGWMSVLELEWLYAKAAKMDSIVEVGVLRGRSCFALLKGCRGPVYAIDPWNDEGEHCFPAFMADCGGFPNLRPIKGYSPAAGVEVPGDVDMTFIDGDHSYESIMADIKEWLPRTRKLICGHDYQNANGGYPDVAVAVHEMFPDRFYVPKGTSIWAVDLK